MNNKYDIGNFAKLLEKFTTQTEMAKLDFFLYGNNKSTEDTECADSENTSVSNSEK